MSPFLTGEQLSERWCITPTTLKQWRWNGRGPCYLKIGGRVLYRLQDIETFEAKKLHKNISYSDDLEEKTNAFNF